MIRIYEEDLTVDEDTRAATEAAYAVLAGLGATFEEVRIRPLAGYSDCRGFIARAEDYAVHEKDFIGRLDDYGIVMRNRAAAMGMISAVDYIQAQRKRLKLAKEIAAILRTYDALVTANYYPTAKAVMRIESS